MCTSWIVSLALIGFGCSSTASQPEVARTEKPATVNGSVPIRSGTGKGDAVDVVEFAHARITRAYDIFAARGSCYLPGGGEVETLVFSDSKRWANDTARPPLPEPGQRADLSLADWARFDPNQEDYDFLGVDVDLSPDGHSILVTSKFGDDQGLMRVVAWIRAKLKP